MPIRERSLEEIDAAVRAYLRTRYPNAGLGDTRFLGKLAAVIATALLMLEQSIERADRDGCPTDSSSRDALDSWAVLFALPNGAGGFGRRGAIAAGGGLASIVGVKGTFFAQSLLATAPDGTAVELVTGVGVPGIAPGKGTITGSFAAVVAGAAGNLSSGTQLTWETPPTGADQSFVLAQALTGGREEESNRELLDRLYEHLQTPPKGAAIQDYREWATAVAGVFQVFVYPLRAGDGSVDLVVMGPGSGAGRDPGQALADAVVAFIADRLPADLDEVNVYRPTFTAPLEVLTRVVLVDGFDWDDRGLLLTVNLFTPGSPATLRFASLAPQSLKDAIDAYKAGTGQAPRAPRLQVLVTDGPTIPVQVRAVDWSDGGGKTTLTLENPLPDGLWGLAGAPTVGDRVVAGGPGLTEIAQAQLAYLDVLGPSRLSGFADELHPWEDTLRIDRLMEIATAATDASARRWVSTILFSGSVPQVFIAAATVDYQGNDATLTTSPEVLRAAHVVVTA